MPSNPFRPLRSVGPLDTPIDYGDLAFDDHIAGLFVDYDKGPTPVKVGDVLTDEDAEPPVGAVVFTNDVHPSAWQRKTSLWTPSNDEWDEDYWSFVGGRHGGATVIYLPDAS